jgi:ATP:ADP antiporter, AAA family
MRGSTLTVPSRTASPLDRALAVFADVRPGEGLTALLMLANIFLLLVCYSIIKTVREPLILLGGGAEVRSYAAAGQAILLMGFVPLYSWAASKVRRMTLVVGATVVFVGCIELFAAAVTARAPYVGVAFFIWVGIFNISLIAQFWSFANDIYTKESGARLFPLIVIGMTAGAPLGSLIAARLFRSGLAPELILQASALLLAATGGLYLLVNARQQAHAEAQTDEPLEGRGGFALVLGNPYLRLIAALIVLLNVVNTTGEYLVARLLSAEVQELAALNPAFDKQAYIGAFTGNYQFWVGVTALLLQAFVTSRLVRHRGLAGVLFALPLIALGGYAIVAAGAGFALVRWVKTAENATDYSIMNTARQMLWLPTSREEKYKAKQAIDTFFVRGGDVLSAAVVFGGTHMLHLSIQQFALANIALTLLWLALAMMIARPVRVAVAPRRRLVAVAAALTLLVAPSQSSGQTVSAPDAAVAADAAEAKSAEPTRESEWAARQADKAAKLGAYQPDRLENQIRRVERLMSSKKRVYTFIGSAYSGGGLAVGPGYRRTFGDSGTFDAHAAWSIKNYKATEVSVGLPELADGRVRISLDGRWLDAPEVAFYGTGLSTSRDNRQPYDYTMKSGGANARVQATKRIAFGGGLHLLSAEGGLPVGSSELRLDPTYGQSNLFVEFDTRATPGYTDRGGYYRFDFTDYRETGGGSSTFQRFDGEAQRYIPIFRDSSVIALRGLVSTTATADGHEVPFFLLPDLGGRDLRGYSSWRFRDRNRVLFTGEYRWAAAPFVDMSLFLDAGTVAPRFDELKLGRMRTSHGVGMTFHTQSQTAFRIELARSNEGMGLLFSFSPRF